VEVEEEEEAEAAEKLVETGGAAPVAATVGIQTRPPTQRQKLFGLLFEPN
jgi:hypothetical protein